MPNGGQTIHNDAFVLPTEAFDKGWIDASWAKLPKLRKSTPSGGAHYEMSEEGALLPISTLTYAVGDVHGRSDLLQSLLDFVRSDSEKRKQEPKVIFLGDIVDRGPDSKGCIELVISTLNCWPNSKLVLGNHDDWFLRVLGTDAADPSVVQAWIRNGGLPTICNYDYEPDLSMARQAIKLDYEHHISLFQRASIIEVDGTFAFVHAGITAFVEACVLDGLIRHEFKTPSVATSVSIMENDRHGRFAVPSGAAEFLQQVLDRCRLLPMNDEPKARIGGEPRPART